MLVFLPIPCLLKRIPSELVCGKEIENVLFQARLMMQQTFDIRGAVEPIFESGFPPGSDQIKTMFHEPYGNERLELRFKHATQETGLTWDSGREQAADIARSE